MVDDGHVVLNGARYQLAHDELVPRGKRAWTRTLRKADLSDPGVIKTARWNLSGPMGASREGADGYLGVDYCDNLDHRYDQLLTSTAKRNVVALADDTDPVTAPPTTTPAAIHADWSEVNGGGTDGSAHNELNSYGAPNDDTYWTTSMGDSGYLIVGLPTQTDPGVDTGHIIRARCVAPIGNTQNVTAKLQLYDTGTTSVIATSEELSVPPIKTVELLDSWTIGRSEDVDPMPTHAVSAGSDRLLICYIMVDHDQSSPAANDVTAVTYGTQSLTHYGSTVSTYGRGERRIEVWYLLEADVAVASGTTMVVTWSAGSISTVDGTTVAVATLGNVDQTTPISDDASDIEQMPLTMSNLNVGNGDYVVAGAVDGWSTGGVTWTATAGYTERFAERIYQSEHHLQDKAVNVSTTEEVTATLSSTTTECAAMAIVIQGASAGSDAATNIEFAIPEVNVANLSGYADLRIGISASSIPAGSLRVTEMQFELPQAAVQSIIGIDEDRGQLFVHRGQKTAQLNPGDMSEVASAYNHGTAITGAVAGWQGSGFVALGTVDLVQKRTSVAADAVASYSSVTGVKAFQLAVGSDRIWITVADGTDDHKVKYALDDIVDDTNFSNSFQVSDPGTPSTGIFTVGEYMVLGHERGANSFTASGKPKRLIEAVKDFPSSNNARSGDSLWGWVYVATELGLYAINVEAGVANPVGPGEGLRGQRFEGPIDGYPTAVKAFKESLWVAYLTTGGDTYVFRGIFGPDTPGSGRPEWFSFYKLSSVACKAIGATAGRTNPTLILGEDANVSYFSLGRRGRDIADGNYRFDAGGGTWYGTTMMRTAGKLANIRAARFFTENCDSGNTWQLAISVDQGSYVDLAIATQSNGLQTVRPVSGTAPLTTVRGSTFKPRLTQVADDDANPPQIRGFVDVTYDERPETVEEHTLMVVLGGGDFSPETEDQALADLLERGNVAAQTPIAMKLPGESEIIYGFVVDISGRMDLDAHGTQAVAVTVLGWDVA